jgi:hemerythrin
MTESRSPSRYVSWKTSFELGIPEVDGEHEQFIRITNELHAAIVRGASKMQLHAWRARLEQYAEFHFKGEEEFLAAVDYPGLSGQQKEHAWFVKCIGELQLDSLEEARSALELASEWLLRHILGTDKLYAAWLAEEKPGLAVELRRAS